MTKANQTQYPAHGTTEKKPFLVATYGTLLKGQGNHPRMLAASGELVGAGQTVNNYNIYAYCGGFPSVSLEDNYNDTPVRVEVYRTDERGLFGPLDCLEGTRIPPMNKHNFYNRSIIDVKLDNGEIVPAWIYHIDEDFEGRLIESGDWKVFKSAA